MKKQGKIREEVKSEAELNKFEAEKLKKALTSIKEQYREHWKDFIVKGLKYKKT